MFLFLLLSLIAYEAPCLAKATPSQQGPQLQINFCSSENAPFQQWSFATDGTGEIHLRSNGLCISVQDYSTENEAVIDTETCHPEDHTPAHQNQAFSFFPDGTIRENMTGSCLDRSAYGTTPGTKVWLYSVTGANNQKWIYNSTDFTLRAVDSGLCLDAGSKLPRPCDVPPANELPFCNTSLSLEERVGDLVERLTLEEMAGLFSNQANPIERFNIQAYQWWNEGLHGVASSFGVSFSYPTPFATSFPQVICTASSFNRTLFNAIGTVISTEARAMANAGNSDLTFWAPNVNIFRDPRWGRGQETPGEDPYLTAEYAAFFVSGMQDGEDPTHLKVSACCKHYLAYNLDNWHGMTRYKFDALTTDQDLSDTYLPAFEACIRRGKVSSIMCSYNAINGVPACADEPFMTIVARETWGFQGVITSDDGAVPCVQHDHHYTNNTDDTCEVTLSAGMDIECGGLVSANIVDAVNKSIVSMETVTQAITNQLLVQFRLGMFDPVETQPYMSINYTNSLNTPSHQQLALSAAAQGIILLKNDNQFLPVKPNQFKSIAMIGPNANATKTLLGNYFGVPPFIVSPLEGVQGYFSEAQYSLGCDVACQGTSGFQEAIQLASQSELTILIVGLDGGQEGEMNDRDSLRLPGYQETLIKNVTDNAGGDVIVAVITGGPIDILHIKNNQKVSAILYTGYPGQSGGQAIADTIFGINNPGGRLTMTLYPADFVNVVSMEDMGMRPNASSGNPGRSYRFYTGEPVYPFGFGLSYTNFTYKNSTSLNRPSISTSLVEDYFKTNVYSYLRNPEKDAFDTITITVTNTGSVAGSDVVLCFVSDPTPGESGNPIKELVGFERVFLEPGQSSTLSFPITPHDLSFVSLDGGIRKAFPGEKQFFIGDLTFSLFLVDA